MNKFEYKYIGSAFSPNKVLQQVEAREKEGWSLYSLETTHFFILGSGGTAGMQAVMRRPLVRETKTDDTG